MGSHNLREITGVVNLPVSDRLKIRLGARRTKRDGLVNNIYGPDMATQDRPVDRASVLFEPPENGRAPCRVRGGTYVEVPVVAVPFINNTFIHMLIKQLIN